MEPQTPPSPQPQPPQSLQPQFQSQSPLETVPAIPNTSSAGQVAAAPVIPVVPTRETIPPLSIRIYYILSLLAMAFGLAAVAVIVFVFGSISSGVSLSSMLVLGILVAYIVGQFYLVHEMKKGKLWALIANTILLSLVSVTMALDFLSGKNTNSLFTVACSIVFFVIFWTKDRKYFR
ncbi:MAG: hypothetical protein WAW63_02870 [Candidatus Saccharimonadales bacterium]